MIGYDKVGWLNNPIQLTCEIVSDPQTNFRLARVRGVNFYDVYICLTTHTRPGNQSVDQRLRVKLSKNLIAYACGKSYNQQEFCVALNSITPCCVHSVVCLHQVRYSLQYTTCSV